ncbi:biliverdin-producing heme oxygenase [Henriciella sp.]|uniref:biliverdin-producing heme oxygenase n=1 Tax=Henriciella sp. TaxID=1968823 RepID=UPI003C792148
MRSDTQVDHTRIDALYSRYDLTDVTGLSRFLSAHAVALSWCLESLPAAMDECRRSIAALILDAGSDLERLGQPSRTSSPAAFTSFQGDPLGLVYVVAGSRLGGRVLLRQVRRADDPLVASSTTYLSSEAGDELWQTTLEALQAWSGAPADEDRLIAGARSGFQYFEDAYFAVQGLTTENDFQYSVA